MASSNEDRNFNQSLDFRKNYNADVREQHNSRYDENTEAKHSRKLIFSPEEKLALEECNRESFYWRGLPFAFIAGVSAHYAVKVGYLKGGKYGSLWKVIGAGVAGLMLGKFSYVKKCEDKLIRIPNSRFADAIRKKRGLSQELFAPLDQTNASDIYSRGEMYDPLYNSDRHAVADMGSGSWEIDDDRNVKFQGLEDSNRLSLDVDYITPGSDVKSPAVYTSYDDLRKQNRNEYEMRRFSNREPSPGPGTQPLTRPIRPPNAANEYGDRID